MTYLVYIACKVYIPWSHNLNQNANSNFRYQARLAYCRTAAVMSMVGYTLGLGDRHGENILFDSVSGDCVHVDFNCLFNKVSFLFFLKARSQIWDNFVKWKLFKKCFLFYLKTSFRSQDIKIFVLTFWSCRKTTWLER